MSRYTLTVDFVARRMASEALGAVRAADARSAARNLASARADLARARAYAAGKRRGAANWANVLRAVSFASREK